MSDLMIIGDGEAAFKQAILRGFLIYEPSAAMNNIHRWRYAGHDRHFNVWFRHIEDDIHLVMPPEETPEETRQAKVLPLRSLTALEGGRS